MRKWMKENRQGKHGAHRHSLEQFGFDPAELEVEYADYRARFGIPFAKRPS
jgi:cellulose synthase/poly-beta-1,6-N-acetylglucosamine synthase-like glycosyltransferase